MSAFDKNGKVKPAEAERLGTVVLSMVSTLKKLGKRYPDFFGTEQYLVDDEFDIDIRVALRPKKSQEEHVKEMFGGGVKA
jgi:hypothetical protein